MFVIIFILIFILIIIIAIGETTKYDNQKNDINKHQSKKTYENTNRCMNCYRLQKDIFHNNNIKKCNGCIEQTISKDKNINSLNINQEQIIEFKLKEIIAEQLDVDISEVVPCASFMNDLGADYLDLEVLIMEVEKEFNIVIPDEESEKIKYVGQAIKYIKSKQLNISNHNM